MLSCRRRSRLMVVRAGSTSRPRDRRLVMLEGLDPRLASWKAGQSREENSPCDTMVRRKGVWNWSH
jgi:hypothetical protein